MDALCTSRVVIPSLSRDVASVKSTARLASACSLRSSFHGASLTSAPAAAPHCASLSSRSTRTSSAPPARASVAVGESELDVVSKFSEVVPDTVVGDDFERFKPQAATVTSSLILGISCLPEAKYDGAIENALAYGQCLLDSANKFSCFLDKALVNVGAELVKVVPGRVSTEVDPRLAHDSAAIIHKVRSLVRLYQEVEVPQHRVLFKIPATWQGIDAARQLEDDGIQTHVTGVNSFAQAAACAGAQVSVIQISVGRIRDWARTHSGDKDISAALERGEDVGVSIVRRAVSYISRQGGRTKVMASNLRSREDVLSLLGVDYLIVPLKVLETLQSTPAGAHAHRSIADASDDTQTFSTQEMAPWTQERFEAQMGVCAKELLEGEIEGAVSQTKRTEEYFAKIWPPPNV